MKLECAQFRARLVARLEAGRRLFELSFHEHLLACASCRQLLDEEQALDYLLTSSPAPEIPRELAERLLARLSPERSGANLDRLLDRVHVSEPPADLGARLLAGLAGAREGARLDRLLERVPIPAPPAGLASRMLAALASERLVPAGRPPIRRLKSGPQSPVAPLRPWYSRPSLAYALAAALLAVLGLWYALRPAPRATRGPSPELLASLDLLQSWELLQGEDVDALLADFDDGDLELIELSGSGAPAETPAGTAPEKGSKG